MIPYSTFRLELMANIYDDTEMGYLYKCVATEPGSNYLLKLQSERAKQPFDS